MNRVLTPSNLGTGFTPDPVTGKFDVVAPTAPKVAGDVLQVVALSDADLPAVTGNGTTSAQFSVNFTPKSANSRLIIQVDGRYIVQGSGGDVFAATVLYRGVERARRETSFASGFGFDPRPVTLLPIQAVCANTANSVAQMIVRIARVSGDDNVTISGSRSLVITEVQA